MLDKETIALLDGQQLRAIAGGLTANTDRGSHYTCHSGGTHCDTQGTSTGCGAGTSQCIAGQ